MWLKTIFIALLGFSLAAESFGQNMTVYKSNVSVDEMTKKLIKLIEQKDLKYFETVSHHEIAKDRSFTIDPANVILFEDISLSSAIIQCEPTAALDLPLKIMVWEEHDDVYIGYFDPILMRRKFLIDECDDVLKKMSGLMVRLVNESLRSK